MKILLLEDDNLLLEILDEFLKERGHEIFLAKDGIEAENLISDEGFDLLLLDVHVPLLSGFEFLKNIRELGDKTPAIFITSLNSSKDLKYGFDIGADDYIKKPFDFEELEARIDNIKRKSLQDDKIELDNSTVFYPNSNIIKRDKKEIPIWKKESELLLYLFKNRGKIVSIDEIIQNIYRYEDTPTESTIRTYIKNLRKILGEESIKNIRGVGYTLK